MIRSMLPAYTTESGGWAVWCPYCGCLHTHGPIPGHVVAHCINPDSPFRRGGGYVLIPTGEPLPEGAIKLHDKGLAQLNRYLNLNYFTKKLFPYTPRNNPEWGKPFVLRTDCETHIINWANQNGKTPKEINTLKRNLEEEWAIFSSYNTTAGTTVGGGRSL